MLQSHLHGSVLKPHGVVPPASQREEQSIDTACPMAFCWVCQFKHQIPSVQLQQGQTRWPPCTDVSECPGGSNPGVSGESSSLCNSLHSHPHFQLGWSRLWQTPRRQGNRCPDLVRCREPPLSCQGPEYVDGHVLSRHQHQVGQVPSTSVSCSGRRGVQGP